MLIQTKRCIIRDFQAGDILPFMAYRNDAGWMQYQGYKGRTQAVYERDLLGGSTLVGGKQFAVVHAATGQLIGDVYLKQEEDVYWLGYTIHPQVARQGYASEAALAIIDWVKARGGSAIKAGVLPENTASIKLLEKLHFTCTGQVDGEVIFTYDILPD